MGTLGLRRKLARRACSLLVVHYSESCEIRQIDVYFFSYETDHPKDNQIDIEEESDLPGNRAGGHDHTSAGDPECGYFPAGGGIDAG